jgi:hypothetical protein
MLAVLNDPGHSGDAAELMTGVVGSVQLGLACWNVMALGRAIPLFGS